MDNLPACNQRPGNAAKSLAVGDPRASGRMRGSHTGAQVTGLPDGARCGIMLAMGSRIEAVIYDASASDAGLPPQARAVALPGGLAMLPVTSDMAARLDPSGRGVTCPGWVLLRRPVAALARQLSAGGRALYIVSETFGGPGIQEAAGWQDGEPWYGPRGTSDIEADLEPGYRLARGRDSAVNAGLRALGVRAVPGKDEYETIGLTRHRYTEDWTANP
jgi:hypothetical protein